METLVQDGGEQYYKGSERIKVSVRGIGLIGHRIRVVGKSL